MRAFASALVALFLMAGPALAADQAAVKRLVQGGKACAGCNLFQAELGYSKLSGVNLKNANLKQATLTVAILSRANLAGSNLAYADLFGTVMTAANLQGADLTDASLVGSHLRSANFAGANLSGADFSGADMTTAKGLTQAQLSMSCGDASTRLPKGLSVPACMPR